jgi:hypothetical protein
MLGMDLRLFFPCISLVASRQMQVLILLLFFALPMIVLQKEREHERRKVHEMSEDHAEKTRQFTKLQVNFATMCTLKSHFFCCFFLPFPPSASTQ